MFSISRIVVRMSLLFNTILGLWRLHPSFRLSGSVPQIQRNQHFNSSRLLLPSKGEPILGWHQRFSFSQVGLERNSRKFETCLTDFENWVWIALHTMHVEHDDMSMHKSLIHITTLAQGTWAHMWMLSRGYACCDPDQKDCSACRYPKLRVLGPGCLDFLGLLNQHW